ncbi:prolipoprotein diacylglyceryl transferase [bacterium]|nr:prolipoprotein diacylglyceryl transferase [bacterium]
MRPTLFTIFGYSMSSYYFMGIVAMIVGILMMLREVKRLGLDTHLAFRGALLTATIGYLGARVQHIVFDGFFEIYLQKPMAMLNVFNGGLAFYGAVIFGFLTVIAFFSMHKVKVLPYADAFGYSLALGAGFGRVGCYLNGCCFGEISASPLAQRFIPWGLSAKNQLARDIVSTLGSQPYPVFPSQVVSAVANFSIFLVLYLVIRPKHKKAGVPLGSWFMMYSVFRFIIEFFRADARGLFFNGLLSSSQLIAITVFIVGLLLVVLPEDKESLSGSNS